MHTKWSPVATASYRLLPDPQLKRHDDYFRGERAKELVAICPMRVFDLEDMVRFADCYIRWFLLLFLNVIVCSFGFLFTTMMLKDDA